MGKVFDIKINSNGEAEVKNGDYVIEESTEQHGVLLIGCEKGENKMEPDSGVGLANWLLDEANPIDLKKEVQSELEADGQDIDSMTFEDIDNFKIVSSYNGR